MVWYIQDDRNDHISDHQVNFQEYPLDRYCNSSLNLRVLYRHSFLSNLAQEVVKQVILWPHPLILVWRLVWLLLQIHHRLQHTILPFSIEKSTFIKLSLLMNLTTHLFDADFKVCYLHPQTTHLLIKEVWRSLDSAL